MEKWNTKYHGIGLRFEDRVVRIKNDEYLRAFLSDEMDSARKLAAFILSAYRHKYQKELKITRESLAVEIWAHFHMQEVTYFFDDVAEHIPGGNLLRKGTDWMFVHMDVIDCGEKEIDNNRFVWDFMARSEAFPTKILDYIR